MPPGERTEGRDGDSGHVVDDLRDAAPLGHLRDLTWQRSVLLGVGDTLVASGEGLLHTNCVQWLL